MRGRIGEARIAVEATPRPQADEDPARATLQRPLQLRGVVARAEDEQGTASTVKERLSSFSICSAAIVPGSCSGRTRTTSTGAVQLSRTKPNWAINTTFIEGSLESAHYSYQVYIWLQRIPYPRGLSR